MKVTIWENDLTEHPERIVQKFVNEQFRGFEVSFLPGLANRHPDEIVESVNVTAVIAKLNLIDPAQVRSLAALLGKRIFGLVAGQDLSEFIFLSNDPLEDAQDVIRACRTKWTEEADDPRNGMTGILQRCRMRFIDQQATSDEVYSANITHNLTHMADDAGIYDVIWHPDKAGITKASQLVKPLSKGLRLLNSDPDRFRKFNSPNGWGDYEALMSFVEQYLLACIKYPEADVKFWG